MADPSIVAIIMGLQAASQTGMRAEAPRAVMTSIAINSRKPQINPVTNRIRVPPRRIGRRENVAATSTIDINRNGWASWLCQ